MEREAVHLMHCEVWEDNRTVRYNTTMPKHHNKAVVTLHCHTK